MGRDQPIQNFTARRKRIEGRDLIGPHEAAIALDVGRKDSGQPALHFDWLRQG
jgi:hypothetical protein